jgi:thiaminase
MNQLSEDVNTIKTAEQAVEQFTGEQFIEWLSNYVTTEMKDWEAIKALSTITTTPEKIKKLMLQRFLALEAFFGGKSGDPGFLGFAIANLSESADPEAESALEILEKSQQRQEELQHWIKLLLSLGITEEEIERTKPKEVVRNYIAELSDLFSNSEWQTAIGTLASYEWANLIEYTRLANLIQRNMGLSEKDLVALTSGSDQKAALDTGHILDKAVFDQTNKHLVWTGASKQLEIRQQLLQGLLKYL